MGVLRKEFGFRTALRNHFWKSVFSLEFLLSTCISIGVVLLLFAAPETLDNNQFLPIIAGINVTIAGITFTGLTLVATLFSRKYLNNPNELEPNSITFFRPYIFAIGVQTFALIICIVVIFGLDYFLFEISVSLIGFQILITVFGLFELIALSRNITYHVVARTRMDLSNG